MSAAGRSTDARADDAGADARSEGADADALGPFGRGRPGLDALAEILAPDAPEEFFDSSWGVNVLHVRGESGRFRHFMPWPRLSEILRRHRLGFPRLRLVRDGKPLPVASYLRHVSGSRQKITIPRIKSSELAKQLREGATLVLDAVDELSEPVEELAVGLELLFREHVQVNMYAGWQTSRGFDLHWDDHDVFILQVAGRKRWSVYGETRRAPLVSDVEKAARPPGEPVWGGTLEDGDLLYIPRGWWHVAEPLAEPTLHLTVGVHNRTGLDLLRWFSERMRASEAFRRDLPRMSSPGERAAHFKRLREELFEAFDDALLERFYEETDSRADSRARVELPFDATPRQEPASTAARVRLLAPRPLKLEAAGGVVEFDSMKRRWRFAEDALLVLRPLEERRECTVAELCDAARAKLEERTVRAFVRELARQGLVALIEGVEGVEGSEQAGGVEGIKG
ncbi:MAG TPA: cupin domain-containing protein [Pyrinomonadaceae bacterium]|nr:cupin domain-containing protein [Pyrinomonadaceae bacterium]